MDEARLGLSYALLAKEKGQIKVKVYNKDLALKVSNSFDSIPVINEDA